MTGYLHIGATVIARVSGTPESLNRMAALNDASLILDAEEDGAEAELPDNLFVRDGLVKIKPARPSLDHAWDGSAAAWVDTLTPEVAWQRAAAATRQERDQRLRDSDWTQLLDVPAESGVRAAWAAYRQALRDITQQAEFPLNIVWPERPEGT